MIQNYVSLGTIFSNTVYMEKIGYAKHLHLLFISRHHTLSSGAYMYCLSEYATAPPVRTIKERPAESEYKSKSVVCS